MTVESNTQGKATVLQVSGRMDAESASEFEEACVAGLTGGVKNLVVNVAELSYVSSMGLRAFLQGAKKAQGSGGAMLLCGMKGMVKEVFDMTHLTPLFPLFDSVDAALASL
jgi:anti-anti-sigma factor